MNEDTTETTKNKWRNTFRQSRGRRKGQFIKKSVVIRREKIQAEKKLCKETNKDIEKDILSGREVMEPSTLAKEMCCTHCKIPLSFEFATEKIQKGLASIYTIKCCKCPMMKSVYTSKLFGEKNNLFAVNAKAAMGIIDAGIGESQFNTLLSSMNISPTQATLLKRYEGIIGKQVENVAMKSCSKNLEEEKCITKNFNDVVEDE